MHERATLRAREDGAVDPLGQLGRAEDHAAARAAQRLVRGGGDDVGVRERAGVQARRDEAGDVGHVDEQQRVDVVGDRGHALEVDDARIGTGAGHDQLGPDLARLALQRVVVDASVGLARRRSRGRRRSGR